MSSFSVTSVSSSEAPPDSNIFYNATKTTENKFSGMSFRDAYFDRNSQKLLLIGSIAATIFLSYNGILPSVICTVALFQMKSTAITIAISIALFSAKNLITGETFTQGKSNYSIKLKNLGPIYCTILIPFYEEAIFRSALQSKILIPTCSYLLPAATYTFLGFQMPIATAVAITIAAALFGAIHYGNDHQNSDIQACNAFFLGIRLGILHYQSGILASFFGHMLNNTFFLIIPNQRNEEKISEEDLVEIPTNSD